MFIWYWSLLPHRCCCVHTSGQCHWPVQHSQAKFTGHLSALLSIITGIVIMVSLFTKDVRPSQSKSPTQTNQKKTIKWVYGYLFSDDKSVIHFVSQVMPLVALFQVADGLVGSCSGVLWGQGRQHLGTAFNLITYYVLALPLGIVLAFYWGHGLPGPSSSSHLCPLFLTCLLIPRWLWFELPLIVMWATNESVLQTFMVHQVLLLDWKCGCAKRVLCASLKMMACQQFLGDDEEQEGEVSNNDFGDIRGDTLHCSFAPLNTLNCT